MTVQQYSLFNNDPGGSDVTHHDAGRKQYHFRYGFNITFNHAPDYNCIGLDEATGSTAFTDENPPGCPDISFEITVDTQQTLQIEIAAETGTITDDGINKSLTFCVIVHIPELSLY
jgi:hypothetical protein